MSESTSKSEHFISVSPDIFGKSLHLYFSSIHLWSPPSRATQLWVYLFSSEMINFEHSSPSVIGTLSHKYFSWQWGVLVPAPSASPSSPASVVVSAATHTWVSDLEGTTLNVVQSPSVFSAQ